MKTFILFPEGDFDCNAILVDAETAEKAVYQWIADGDVDFSASVCALPFDDVKVYKMKVVVDDE